MRQMIPAALQEKSEKPPTVLHAEWALWIWTAWICLSGIVQSWKGIPEIQRMMTEQFQSAFTMTSGTMMEIIIATYGVLAAASAFIVWKIGAGKNWARASLLWGFVFEVVCALCPPWHDSIWAYLTDIPDYGLQGYALYLLYTPPGEGWFQRGTR